MKVLNFFCFELLNVNVIISRGRKMCWLVAERRCKPVVGGGLAAVAW